MLLGNRTPVVQTRHPTEPLADERIAQVLADAFPPHRCTVEFQDDRRRVALRVRGPNGAEYVVEGKRLDLLRDLDALAQYIKRRTNSSEPTPAALLCAGRFGPEHCKGPRRSRDRRR